MPLPLSLINQTPDLVNVTDLGLLIPPGSGTILDITGLYLVEEVRDSVSLATFTVASGIVVISGSEGVLGAAQAERFFQGSQIAEQNFTTEGIDLRELRNTAVLAGDNIVVTSGEDFQGFRTFTVSTADNVVTDALVGAGNVAVVSGTNIITISGTAIGIANRQVLCRIGGPFAQDTVLDLLNPGPGWEVEGDEITFADAEEFTRSLQIYRNGQLLFPGTTVTGLNDAYFVSASGSFAFQSPILTNDIVQIWEFAIGPSVTAGRVTDINDVSGSIDLVGAGEVFITTDGQTITVSGTPHITDTDTDTVSDALIGVDGITIISGSNITTVSGFRDEFVNASGSLQIQIDSFTVSSGVSSVNALGGDIDIVGKDQVSVTTEGQTIVVSGLPTETDVDSINTVTGTVTVEGVGEVNVTTAGQTITISGTPHPADKDTVSDALVGGVGITVTSGSNVTTIDGHLRYTPAENDAIIGAGEVVVISGTNIITISGTPHPADKDTVSDALAGVDGITVLSGTSITTISGFRSEFVSSSGSLQEQIDNIESGEPAIVGGVGITVTSGIDTTTIDGHLRYTSAENDAIIGAGEVVVTSGTGIITISGTPHPADQDTISDALIGVDGITIISGSNTTTISGFRTEFVNASGSLQIQIDAIDVDEIEPAIVGAGEVVVTSGISTTTVSGTPHPPDEDDVDSINTVTGTVTISGAGGTEIITTGQNITVSGAADVGLTVVSGIGYIPDDTRDKTLSIGREPFTYGRTGNVKETFLAVHSVIHSETGYVMPRDGTITSVTFLYVSGPTGDIDIVLNGDTGSPIHSLAPAAGTPFVDDAVNVDFDGGDILQIYVANTANVRDPVAVLEVAWRTT